MLGVAQPHSRGLVILTAVAAIAAPGGSTTPGNAGGEASISTWVIGAVNGGVSAPAGVSSCTPWQLLQEGATINPICSRARPWILSTYCAAACALEMRYSSVSVLLL